MLWLIVAASAAVLAVAAGIVLASAGGDESAETAAGEGVGGVAYETFDGETRSLATYAGEPLVVNFFASWCAPCLAEMPGFEEVHQRLGDQVAFLGINLQDQVDAGLAVIEETGITYDVGRDPDGTTFTDLGGFTMPTTLLVSPAGEIVEFHSGEISAQQLEATIQSELLS